MRLFVSCAALLLPLVVHAELETAIIVTGEFRETELDALPASVW